MPKTQISTQKFTEISLIDNDIVVFMNANACIIIEVSPTNFSLLSREEQDSRIFGYASFLNSLTFSIQILINNRRVDVSSYLYLLDAELKNAKNEQTLNYLKQYKSFVENLVKENVILDKKFYVVIPYSHFETGAVKTLSNATQKTSIENMLPEIKATLHTKAEGLLSQISRMGLQTKVLENEELTALFHQLYNEEPEDSSTISGTNINPVSKEEKK